MSTREQSSPRPWRDSLMRLPLAAFAACLMYKPAGANTPDPAPQPQADAAGSSSALGAIVVTAERWRENSQSVPIAIAPLTAAALRQNGINSTLGLQQDVPELQMTTNATNGEPYLRGVGTDIINVGTDNSIAVYQDGVYQARAADSISEFYDVNRVDVVMGPQGTLFGRNAAGGAISIETNDPVDRFEAGTDLQLGNYDQARDTAMVNLPISPAVAFRAASFYDYHEGYSTYEYLPGYRDDGVDAWGTRAKLRIKPTGSLSFILAGEYTDDRSSRNLAPIVDSALYSPAIDAFGATPSPNPRVVQNNSLDVVDVTQSRVYGTLRWEIGDAQLKSITAYENSLNDQVNLDIDATDVDFAHISDYERSKTFSQELQLASSPGGGPLHWVAGMFYFHESAAQVYPITINVPTIPAPPPDAVIAYNASLFTHAYAAYGQASYRIGRIRLTAGTRYNDERKKSTFLEAMTDPYHILSPNGSFTLTNPQNQSWNAWTPRFDVDYIVKRDVMVYVSATRGFKSGGMNLMGSGEVFQPETLWDYEGGIKATWLDRRLRTNLDYFRYDYENMQVSVFNGFTTIVTNVPRSTVTGFEANLWALPAPGLLVDLHLALLDARVGQFSTLNPNTGELENITDNILPRAPKKSLTAGAQYTFPFRDFGQVTLSGQAKYQSMMYFTYWDDASVSEGGYTLFNARLSYQSQGTHWYLALYGRNLGNKLYRTNMIQSTTLIGTLEFWGPPRTFGLEAGWKY